MTATDPTRAATRSTRKSWKDAELVSDRRDGRGVHCANPPRALAGAGAVLGGVARRAGSP